MHLTRLDFLYQTIRGVSNSRRVNPRASSPTLPLAACLSAGPAMQFLQHLQQILKNDIGSILLYLVCPQPGFVAA